jgi:DnaJ-class molecular chaperone
MLSHGSELSIEDARERLGLEADAPLSELQGAFQRALAASRGPDDHVPPDRYRQILEAYRVLRTHGGSVSEARKFEVWPSQIELTPFEAVAGGMKVGRLPNGRPFETKLPAYLRDGDLVWVWGWLLQVRIDEGDELAVRGDDIWITARKHPTQLKAGARVTVETPMGPCSFRLSAEAVEAGLARAPGLGLPASRGHATGDLYVRLVADARVPHGPAELLKRLAPRRAA